MASVLEVSENEDDVIICSVTLLEEYGGWVKCLHPGCTEELDIEQLESHQQSHADEEFARALQESDDTLISANERDYELALSLQEQETTSTPDKLMSDGSVTPVTQSTYTPAKPDTLLSNNSAINSTHNNNTHAKCDSKPTNPNFTSATHGSVARPNNGYRKRDNTTQSNFTYKPTKQSYTPGSNVHTLSSVTSPISSKGRGEGGYETQTVNKLEALAYKGTISSQDLYFKKLELMKNLSSGRDDLESCTKGAVESIRYSYSLFTPPWCFYLSLETPHFSYSLGDRGWGCGYRNIQMIIGSLLLNEKYKVVLSRVFNGNVPTVPRLQEMLDKAWKDGYDPQGAKDLGYKVRNTKTWIGAIEVAVLFRSFGIKAEVVDFLQPVPNKPNVALLQWVERFFKGSTDCPPLYLQHSGHSRTIIGWGQYKSNQYLTILDPMTRPDRIRKCVRLKERELVWVLSRMSSHFTKPQYQIVYVNGLIESHKIEAYKVISPIERLTH